MDDSMARPLGAAGSLDLPAWKTAAGHLAALATAILFLSAGIWKITDPFKWVIMVEQLKVPYQLSMPLTLALGISEALAGVLVLVPRFRRWGAILAAVLLIVFMIYIGIFYNDLIGKDCSCFPWMKRTIGPGFFVGDILMLVAAWLAWLWAGPSWGKRSAGVILGALAVFAGASYGVNAARQTGAKAPDSILVDGKLVSLQHGRIFVYFFDPQCTHCEMAAKKMGKMNFGSTRVIAVATASPQWAASFLRDTNFKVSSSTDAEILRQSFPFGDPPYGVVLENGRQKAPISRFDGDEPAVTLKKLGVIE